MYLLETYKNHETRKINFIFALLMILLFINVVWAAPPDSIIVKAKHTNINTKSIYEVSLLIEQEIPPTAKIIVMFPNSFDLTGVSVASSTTINGGFDVSVKASKVILTRSGLGRIIKPNEKVDVKFANVKNPAEAGDNYKIKVEIKDESDITITEKEQAIKIIPQIKK